MVESYFWLIECSFQSVNKESNSDWDIQRLQDYFLTIFDRSIKPNFNRSKMLYLEFSLRKFQNLNFHFMKQYSPNSNIIITTYLSIYIYLYIYIYMLSSEISKWTESRCCVLVSFLALILSSLFHSTRHVAISLNIL